MKKSQVQPGSPAVPDPARVAQVAALARGVRRERELAPAQIDGILAETPRADVSSLAERQEFQSIGALDHLSDLSSAAIPDDPVYAEQLARLAVSIAEGLQPPDYPAVVISAIRGQAWADVGRAERAQARYEHAVRAFTRAAMTLGFGLMLERAIVGMELALTHRAMGQLPEALQLLSDCERIFRDYGDEQRASEAASLAMAVAASV
jgi:tetratricopeptide (TPR) repeat protein